MAKANLGHRRTDNLRGSCQTILSRSLYVSLSLSLCFSLIISVPLPLSLSLYLSNCCNDRKKLQACRLKAQATLAILLGRGCSSTQATQATS